MAYIKKNPEAQRPLQVEVKTQEQWDELMAKEGLIVVDAYAAWCGPCKAIISSFKRLKNEIGDDLLHFATAETDGIDTLEKYRMKSQPTFLFYAGNTLVNAVRGCHCPLLLKTIKKELEKEHKVLEGQADRARFIDDQVEKVAVEEAVEEKPPTEEEEEEEIVAEEMNRYRSSHILEKKAEKEAKLAGKEVHIPKQVTVAIIKPDAVKAGLVDEIIKKVEEMGIEVLKKEERTLTKEEAAEFYKQHEQSEHFEQLTEFMSSGPLTTLVLSKAGETPDAVEGVIESFRELIGPKDVNTAKEEAPESLRALYGTDTVMNAVHGCDSSESAARELAFFFPDFVAPTVVNKRKKKRLQRTLALVRPDALRTRKDSIINKIKEAGFMIAMSKEMQLTREQAEEFYAQHKEQEFFETLVNNMISGPMMALCLAREDAVEGWREMLGPKEVAVAKEEAPDSLDQLGSGVSLRAQFQVEDSPVNPLHGSDSLEAAEKEIRKFFPLQSTVAVIKPEVESDQQEIIKQRIKEAGFTIQAQKEITLTKELASQFYQEHEGKEFFGDLTEYMASGKTMFMVLSKEDAVSGWRALMGPTDPTEAKEAAPDTLRAQFGVDKMKNIVHGSSNPEKAVEVIKEFFPEVELCPDGTVKSKEEPKKEEAIVEENYSLALGLEDGKISDDAITASSILDDAHAAQCCRLNGKTEEKKGAWAAKDTDENQWLQVNLGQYARISSIATQGENGESVSHVKSYSLSYSRDGESFVAYSDEVFEGNTDQDTVMSNELPQPLITQYIRINPKSWNEQIALRMELYGFDADTFTESLGVADGKIPDACISASSSLDDNHSPSQCRLNAKEEGDKMAGWAAKDNDENQWIQIDFGRLAEITQVSTQGKGGESTHHVTSYLLSFSTDGESFTAYQEGGQDKVFDGNADQETVVSHWLALPPVSHYVRLHPKTWNEHIALRLDFAGRYKEQEAKEKIEVDKAPAETGEAIAAGDQEQPQETTAEQEASQEGAVEDKKDDPQRGEELSQEKQEDSAEKPTEEPAEKPAEDSAEVPAAEGEAAAGSETKETEGGEESTEAKPEDVSADAEPAPEKSEEQPQTKDGESGGKPEGGEEQAGAEEMKKDDEPKPEGENAGDSEKPKEGEGEATIPPEGEDQG